MSPRVPLAALAVPLAVSCFSPLQVRDADGVEQPGLLFYAKRGVHRQTTERVTTWEEARLTVRVYELGADGKLGEPIVEFDEVRGINAENRPVLDGVKGMLATGSSTATAIRDRFAQGMIGDALEREELVGNSIEVVTVVDYANPRHLKMLAPVFGTSSFKPELAPDGTLTKLEASVTSTPEKAAELLPAKELFMKVLPLAAGADTETFAPKLVPGREQRLSITLEIEQRGFRDVWSYDWPDGESPLLSKKAELTPLDDLRVPASRKRLPLAAPKPEAKEPEGYTFSGKLTPPKEKG